MEQSVFLAIPVAGNVVPESIFGLTAPTRRGKLRKQWTRNSATPHNFNVNWCQALNTRSESGLTHFAMHHSDIGSPAFWVDSLIDEMDRVGADILSCVVAIKDEKGLSSTAVREENAYRRLTMKEVYDLPETFSVDDVVPDKNVGAHLLINTGLWVCKFTGDWPERFFLEQSFRYKTWGIKKDGVFQPRFLPEDWLFADWAQMNDLKVFATRKLVVEHIGDCSYRNDCVWGTWQKDMVCK